MSMVLFNCHGNLDPGEMYRIFSILFTTSRCHSLWYKPPTSSNAKQSINYVFLCLSVKRRDNSEVAIFPVVTANVVPLS